MNKKQARRAEAIIPLIYEAALDRSLWSEVMRRFGDLIDAHCSALIRQNQTSGTGQAVTIGFDPALMREYFGYYASRNVLLRSMGKPPPGLVFGDRDVMPKEKFRNSEYYNDFLSAKLDINAVLMGSLWLHESDVVAVNFCRSSRSGEIESEDKRQLVRLVPHFQRAFALSLRLATLESSVLRGLALLDRSAHGILVLDAAGSVQYANAVAERLLAAADGLSAGRAGLGAAIPAQSRQLAAAIARAARSDEGAAVRIDRPRCGRPLYVLVTPMAPESEWMQPGFRARVLVLLRDPAPRPALSVPHLRALFGLTPAEARVALCLHQGQSAAAIAETLGISRHTARTHLNNVLRKTDTHRQSELIRRLTLLADLADPRLS